MDAVQTKRPALRRPAVDRRSWDEQLGQPGFPGTHPTISLRQSQTSHGRLWTGTNHQRDLSWYLAGNLGECRTRHRGCEAPERGIRPCSGRQSL